MSPQDNAARAERGLLLIVAARSDAPSAALRSTALHLADLCDRAGLLFEERLSEGLSHHAADVRHGGRAPRGPFETRDWRPPLRIDAGGPGDQRAWLAEDALAGVHGDGPIATRVTEALRDLAHCADRLGEDPVSALDVAAHGGYGRQPRGYERARRDRERFPEEDPVVAGLARRVAALDAASDTLESGPVARWRWATPHCTFWQAEPLYAERRQLPPGAWLGERPAGEADEVGFDATGRAVALRGWRIGAGGEPRLLEEWLRWPAGDGLRETAFVSMAHLHWAGRERDDATGRLAESWQLWHARSWRRERYAYDDAGRLIRVHQTQASATAPPLDAWHHIHYGPGGALSRIEHASDGVVVTLFPPEQA